jgi:ergothioneine biosynthesis protein EgtB
MKTSLAARSPRATRASSPPSLAQRFAAIRAQTERLAAPLSAEDACAQSMPDASPTKWHLAHTSWFFETFVLETASSDHRPFDPAFRVLFNSYYNGVGEQHPRPQRGLLTRPSLDRVLAYRAHVDERVQALLERDADALAATIELGLQHEQQHQELILTDAKHLLGANPLRPAYRSDLRVVRAAAPPLSWCEHAGGLVEIGAAGTGFRFDNEEPRHAVHLAPFALASRPVTNREWLGFVEAGGYGEPSFWLSDGWATVRAEGWSAPACWERRDGGWLEFTLGGLRPLDLEAPVSHLCFYEADAYARFAGARLPTEAEWEVAASGAEIAGNTVEADALHPMPCDDGANGAHAQLFGDVWEWTQSPYVAYPGFRPAPGAIGEYNGKFMCNQLVLRGGSCATPRSHLRASYRNFFPPAARWQFSGLRLAKDLE